MITLLIVGGIVVVVAVIYVANRYLTEKRTRNLQTAAVAMNFTFSEKSDQAVQDALGGFHLFSQGYSRRISNVLTGMYNDIPVMLMDYKYTTGSGKNSHTWQQTVLALESEKLQLPSFVLRPENLFDKIRNVFGKKDINFETAPVFSKRYSLKELIEESVRKSFNDWVIEYYEQHPGISTEGDGRKLIFYRASKRVSPDKIQTFLQEGYEVFGLFKNY